MRIPINVLAQCLIVLMSLAWPARAQQKASEINGLDDTGPQPRYGRWWPIWRMRSSRQAGRGPIFGNYLQLLGRRPRPLGIFSAREWLRYICLSSHRTDRLCISRY